MLEELCIWMRWTLTRLGEEEVADHAEDMLAIINAPFHLHLRDSVWHLARKGFPWLWQKKGQVPYYESVL